MMHISCESHIYISCQHAQLLIYHVCMQSAKVESLKRRGVKNEIKPNNRHQYSVTQQSGAEPSQACASETKRFDFRCQQANRMKE